MRILLIEAPLLHGGDSGQTSPVVPLGLASLAATLHPQHEALLAVPDAWSTEARGAQARVALAERLAAEQPDLIGLSATSASWNGARLLAGELRQRLGAVPLLVGGPHASACPAQAAAAPEFDAVVAGEADLLLPTLVESWRSRGRFPLGRLPGVWGRGEAGEVVVPPAERAPLPELEHLPRPRRAGLLQGAEPWPASAWSGLTASRGCPFCCSYCAVPRLGEGRLRLRPVAGVLAEVDELRDRWAVPSLFFHDSVFTASRRQALELTRGLAARTPSLPYSCQTRADRLDPELLDALAGSGCAQLLLGIETGSPRSAARIGKTIDEARLRQVVAWVRARGIRCASFFIVGFPWETEADLRATARLALSLELDGIHLFSACPLPGSRLWDETGGFELSGSFDFRTPWRNFTALPDRLYAAAFRDLQRRFAEFNQRRLPPSGGSSEVSERGAR